MYLRVNLGNVMKRNGFGDRLKQLLKQKKLTQAQAATAVSTSVPSVNRWTKGGEIEYDNLRTLADFLEVNWVWLRYGDEAIESLQNVTSNNSDTMTDMRREYLNQILDNEARMKSALEMAEIVNWEWNVLTGALSHSNNAFNVFGTEPEHIRDQMLPFEHADLDTILSLFNAKEPHTWDFKIEMNNTGLRWFTSRARIVFDTAKRPIKVIGISGDISDRKSTEQALERSEYMMRKIVETVPVGLWAADEKGKICLANPEVKRIWGGAKYVGLDQYGEYKGWWEKTGKEVGSEGWTLARAVSDGETSTAEVVNIEAFDGERRTIIMHATPLYDNDSNIIGAIEVNQDITDIKQTERSLRKELEQWQSVFDQSLFGVIKLNDDLQIMQHNSAFSVNAAKQLSDLFDKKTTQSIQQAIHSCNGHSLHQLSITGRITHTADLKNIYILHNNHQSNDAITFIFTI